ncbi:hypothetical protein JCM14036_14780 [Desulfotomaculum defluvii]
MVLQLFPKGAWQCGRARSYHIAGVNLSSKVSQPLVASLGALRETSTFKRRQQDSG